MKQIKIESNKQYELTWQALMSFNNEGSDARRQAFRIQKALEHIGEEIQFDAQGFPRQYRVVIDAKGFDKIDTDKKGNPVPALCLKESKPQTLELEESDFQLMLARVKGFSTRPGRDSEEALGLEKAFKQADLE